MNSYFVVTKTFRRRYAIAMFAAADMVDVKARSALVFYYAEAAPSQATLGSRWQSRFHPLLNLIATLRVLFLALLSLSNNQRNSSAYIARIIPPVERGFGLQHVAISLFSSCWPMPTSPINCVQPAV